VSTRALIVACLAVVGLVALAAVGCGGEDKDQGAAVRAPSPVKLSGLYPGNATVVREETVTVEGQVEPARADVRVLGRRATVTGGTFTVEVPLEPGANVIDVMASAGGRSPAMTALRVVREVPVDVPDVEGHSPEDAQEKVEAAGLKLDVQKKESPLDEILPGGPTVCEQLPPAGTEVRRGSSVQVIVAEIC
jgi:hypothetical protein